MWRTMGNRGSKVDWRSEKFDGLTRQVAAAVGAARLDDFAAAAAACSGCVEDVAVSAADDVDRSPARTLHAVSAFGRQINDS